MTQTTFNIARVTDHPDIAGIDLVIDAAPTSHGRFHAILDEGTVVATFVVTDSEDMVRALESADPHGIYTLSDVQDLGAAITPDELKALCGRVGLTAGPFGADDDRRMLIRDPGLQDPGSIVFWSAAGDGTRHVMLQDVRLALKGRVWTRHEDWSNRNVDAL